MDHPFVTRRLAAILIADVVGYTRLMERDEAATHARLHELRDDVIDPRIAEYGGRVVKTAGDGMLIEFSSATAALRCAVEVQRDMGHRNLYVAPDTKIEFRIGINLGDILVDGADIAGDGVNVASRLETLAEPGGICVASTVYEQIHEDLGFGFVDIGEQQVKNIARPIRAYRVTLGKGATAQLGLKKILRRPRWVWVAAAIGFATGCVLVILFVRGWPGQSTTLPPVLNATLEPPPLSIAILPLAMVGGSPSDDQLAESITQDATTALARSARYASVVSHRFVSGYKGKSIDARAVGRELNVRYVTDGEIRRVGDKLAIITRLLDTRSATQVWNDRLDIADAHLPAGHDAIAEQLSRRIKTGLVDAELRRATNQPGASATAVDLWLRGAAMTDGTLKGARDARKLFDEALRLDPNLIGALVGQVEANATLLFLDPHADRDRLVQEMEQFSLRAVAANRNDPRAWYARADALAWQWRWAEAFEANAQVSRIDPGQIYVHYQRGYLLIFTGRAAEVFAQLDKVVAVEPREANDGEFLRLQCKAHLNLGHYDEVINACERAAALDNVWITHLYLAAAYAKKGEIGKASAAQSQLLKLQPGYTIARYKARRVTDNPIFWQQEETHIYPGLRKAGVPEQ